MLDRAVGRDLQRHGRTVVLCILQQLLRAAAPPQQLERCAPERQRCAPDRECLPDEALQKPDAELNRATGPIELGKPLLCAFGVVAGFAQVQAQDIAIGAPLRHLDPRREDIAERLLHAVSVTQVVGDLLLAAHRCLSPITRRRAVPGQCKRSRRRKTKHERYRD